jgi:SWIM zinc finger
LASEIDLMASTTTPPISKADLARSRMFGIKLPKLETAPTPKPTPKPATGKCGLTLRINGVPYKVRKLDAEFGRVRAFRLTKTDGQFHDVIDGLYGPSCSCGDFVFRRDGIDPRGCKHILAARAVGLLD